MALQADKEKVIGAIQRLMGPDQQAGITTAMVVEETGKEHAAGTGIYMATIVVDAIAELQKEGLASHSLTTGWSIAKKEPVDEVSAPEGNDRTPVTGFSASSEDLRILHAGLILFQDEIAKQTVPSGEERSSIQRAMVMAQGIAAELVSRAGAKEELTS